MKLIHQIWLQGEEKLPKRYKKYSNMYKSMKDYNYTLWDDKSIRKLIKNKKPHLYEIYDGYEKWIMRVDLAKYIILQVYGGFYIDMDTYPKKSLNEIVNMSKGKPVIVGYKTTENPKYKIFSFVFPYILNNNFMYSPYPKHPFYEILSEKSKVTKDRKWWDFKLYYVLGSIGPFYLFDVVKKYGLEGINLLNTSKLENFIHDEHANSWCNASAFIMDLDKRDKIVIFIFLLLIFYAIFSIYKMRVKK